MRYRKLDANGDYTLGTGADFYRDQPEAVAQAVGTRLKLWTGEWFLDKTEGTPYNQILGKSDPLTRDALLKERILGTAGMQAIDDYSSDFNGDARRFTVSATIDTIYGQATIGESF